MKRRYREYRKGRVELIPMIDVMLFLLVFFIIVTLQMIPDAGVNLQLPQASQVQHLPHPKFTVNLLTDGTIQVKGQALTADALTALLAGDGDPAKTQVTIAADKHVAFQYFVQAMDASRKAGVTDIGIAAQPTGPLADQSQQDQSGTAQPTASQPAGSASAATSAPSAAPAGGTASGSSLAAPAAPPAAASPAALQAGPAPAGQASTPTAPGAPQAAPRNAPAAVTKP
jgi:biopolymer transport protein ExbD